MKIRRPRNEEVMLSEAAISSQVCGQDSEHEAAHELLAQDRLWTAAGEGKIRCMAQERGLPIVLRDRVQIASWEYTPCLSIPCQTLSSNYIGPPLAFDEACRLTSIRAVTVPLVPLFSRILAQSGLHLLFVATDVYAESKLLPQNLLQRTAVSDVDPLALSGALLVVHALALDCPVEALGSRQRRREPDLLVGRLLVEHV